MSDDGRRATIREVARAAGVSTVTVSRVLNEPAVVQAETRHRVERAMRELAYVPNLAARTMRTRATRSVGIVVPDLVSSTNAAVAQAAEQQLGAAGYSLLLVSSDFRPEREVQALELLHTRQVDGLLLYVSDERDPALAPALGRLGVPCVVLDRTLAVTGDVLLSEHASPMAEVVRYLAAIGHRRIALLLTDLAIRPALERRAALEATTRELGLVAEDQVVLALPPGDPTGDAMVQALFDRIAPPTAVIASGSRLVRAILAAARARGLDVPGRLSIVAVDAPELVGVTSPELTAITRDYAEIGRTAATMLLDRLADPQLAPRRVVLGSEVVLRGSCAPPQGGGGLSLVDDSIRV